MAKIVGPPASAIRCLPIASELRDLLDAAADATGIDKIVIASGGQPSNHAPHMKGKTCGWKGSPRHDNGRAADIELVKGGKTLSFSDTDGSQVEDFVTACAARGATGIGAGVHYMGRRRIHVGFGKTPSDHQKLTWGAAGQSANAPAWLRIAASKGWGNPVATALTAEAASAPTSGRSTVMARNGLWLRHGPGLIFDRAKLLPDGTVLTVMGFDGEWARVDLEGDGRIDGHVFSAFLGSTGAGDGGDADEGSEEAIDEVLLAELDEEEDEAKPTRASRTRNGPTAAEA